MSEIDVSNYEVVGFDGSMLVECGRANPVVRHRQSGTYLSLSGAVLGPRYHEHEILTFAEQGRVTLLPRPLPALYGGNVVFVAEHLFKVPGLSRPNNVENETLEWLQLSVDDHGHVWVASVSSHASEILLNGWGRALLGAADAEIVSSKERKESIDAAGHLIDSGLAAAVEPDLRLKFHLRSALVQVAKGMPDVVGDTFELFISREFPTWTWSEFVDAYKKLGDILLGRSSPEPRTSNPLTLTSDGEFTRSIRALVSKSSTTAHPFALDDAEQASVQRLANFGIYQGRVIRVDRTAWHFLPMELYSVLSDIESQGLPHDLLGQLVQEPIAI